MSGRRKQGFTLMETVLALFVVALGLLAVFTLFPSGIKMAENAQGDTLVSLFADEVFNGLRAAYATNWSDATPELNSTLLADQQGESHPIQISAGALPADPETIEFRWTIVGLGRTLDHALRYKVAVSSEANNNVELRKVRLQVSFGKYAWNYTEFYTECYPFRMRP